MQREPVFSSDLLLQVAQVVTCTEAEGPGKRFAIWFQGCPLRCSGCCNPEMLPFYGGNAISLNEMMEQIKTAQQMHHIEGISLIGGEPTSHAAGAALLAQETQQLGLSVMVYSGFTLEELHANRDADVEVLLKHTDLLVDGEYRSELPDTSRRWIGSTNQKIHFLTDRYHSSEAYWDSPDTLEIRLEGNQVTINGFPAKSAVGVWKRLEKRTQKTTKQTQGEKLQPQKANQSCSPVRGHENG